MPAALLLALLTALAAGPAAAASVLVVDEARGATLQQLQGSRALAAGDAVPEGAAVQLSTDGQLRLLLARHGFAELSPGGELAVERVPAAPYSEDLRTVLRLDRGLLRLVWRYPAATGQWPLLVYFGTQRVSLASGEYFFDLNGERATLCVVAGEASTGAAGAVRPSRLNGPACYRLAPDAAPARRVLEAEALLTLRTQLSLADQAQDVVSASAPTPAPAPALAQERRPAPPSTPLPAVAPAPPSTPAVPVPPATGRWTVNVVSSTSAAAAEKDAARLRSLGVAATVQAVDVQGRPWYRVQVAGIASQAEARALAQRLQGEFGYPQPWLQQQR